MTRLNQRIEQRVCAVASSHRMACCCHRHRLARRPPRPGTPPAQTRQHRRRRHAPDEAPARPRPARQAAAVDGDRQGHRLVRRAARRHSGDGQRAGGAERLPDPNGEVRFAAVRAGTYRLRFEGEKVITFEREITVGGSRPSSFEVSLSPAPPPPPPPPAPKPEPARAARLGRAAARSEDCRHSRFRRAQHAAAREPSKTTLVACGARRSPTWCRFATR